MALELDKRDFFLAILLITLSYAGYKGMGGQWAFDLKPEETKIRQEIIERSVRSYPGKCACPYNIGWDGKKCGRKSAYTKQGRASTIICYNNDIPEDMMDRYRRKYRLPTK